MDENTAYELAYHNGKARMREAILEKLGDMKGNTLGLPRAVLSDVIDVIKKLEVRP